MCCYIANVVCLHNWCARVAEIIYNSIINPAKVHLFYFIQQTTTHTEYFPGNNSQKLTYLYFGTRAP